MSYKAIIQFSDKTYSKVREVRSRQAQCSLCGKPLKGKFASLAQPFMPDKLLEILFICTDCGDKIQETIKELKEEEDTC